MNDLLAKFYALSPGEREILAQGEALEEPWLNPVDSLAGGLATLPKGAAVGLADFLMDIPISLALEGMENQNPELLKAMYVGKRGMKNLGIDAGQDLAGQFSGLWDRQPRMEIDDRGLEFHDYRGTGGGLEFSHKKLRDSQVDPDGYTDMWAKPKLVEHDLSSVGARGGYAEPKTWGGVDGKKYESQPARILLNNNLSQDERLSTLAHELQHDMQYREGYPRGGSPDDFKKEHAELTGMIKTINQQMSDALKRGGDKEYHRLMDVRSDIVPKVQELEGAYGMVGVDQYERLAGEIEARDTAARMNLSPEERMRTQPLSSFAVKDGKFGTTYEQNPISLDDFIVRMDGGESLSYNGGGGKTNETLSDYGRDIAAREVRGGRVSNVQGAYNVTPEQAEKIRELGGGTMLRWLGGEHTGDTGHFLVRGKDLDRRVVDYATGEKRPKYNKDLIDFIEDIELGSGYWTELGTVQTGQNGGRPVLVDTAEIIRK